MGKLPESIEHQEGENATDRGACIDVCVSRNAESRLRHKEKRVLTSWGIVLSFRTVLDHEIQRKPVLKFGVSSTPQSTPSRQ